MKCKLVGVFHTEFEQNLWVGYVRKSIHNRIQRRITNQQGWTSEFIDNFQQKSRTSNVNLFMGKWKVPFMALCKLGFTMDKCSWITEGSKHIWWSLPYEFQQNWLKDLRNTWESQFKVICEQGFFVNKYGWKLESTKTCLWVSHASLESGEYFTTLWVPRLHSIEW
jgi:hypothetical protein